MVDKFKLPARRPTTDSANLQIKFVQDKSAQQENFVLGLVVGILGTILVILLGFIIIGLIGAIIS